MKYKPSLKEANVSDVALPSKTLPWPGLVGLPHCSMQQPQHGFIN
jgi:hypothetical protein